MTLTTEQLRARAKFWREKAVEAKWESVSIAQDMLQNADAFDELAANREAQPVGYIGARMLEDLTDGTRSCGRIWPSIRDKLSGEDRLPLYTAPPAPAVPDAIITAPIEAMRCGPAASYVLGWNSCRTAMLAQPVSSGYKLPDNVREALTLALHAMEFMGDTLNNIDAVCTEDVEYVTPAFNAVRELLAAAPEGENDHDTRR
ncbi:hypothetical protein [Serratia sp. 201]|uniref:hypothetical protein n=1 Tax=Serratia sp. 201 TaxID=3096764 RepID=UPI00300BC167